MWKEVLERFPSHAPVSVKTRVALEHVLPACWLAGVMKCSGPAASAAKPGCAMLAWCEMLLPRSF